MTVKMCMSKIIISLGQIKKILLYGLPCQEPEVNMQIEFFFQKYWIMTCIITFVSNLKEKSIFTKFHISDSVTTSDQNLSLPTSYY